LFDAPGHHHDHGGASLGPCTWHPNHWPLPTFGCASPAGKQKGWLFRGDLVSGGEILALDNQVMSIDVNWSGKMMQQKDTDWQKETTNQHGDFKKLTSGMSISTTATTRDKLTY
jgi:hypothetical protein